MDVDGDQPQSPHHKIRKDKAQLSCNLCRKRKLRCDRQRPCSTCSSRGLSLSCTYPAPKIGQHTATAASSQSSVLGRLVQLENLLVSLVGSSRANTTAESRSPARSPQDVSLAIKTSSSWTPDLSDSGSMRIGTEGTTYVGSAHWAAIMDGISELKDSFGGEEAQFESQLPGLSAPASPPSELSIPDGPQLLFGCPKSITRESLLAAMPERSVVDRLVFQYFNNVNLCEYLCAMPQVFRSCLQLSDPESSISDKRLVFPHKNTFLRQYEEFWANPAAVSLSWLALLYSLMCLISQSYLGNIGPQTQPPTQPPFLEQVVQCLVLGNYSRGGPHTMEALLHYLSIEQVRRPDSEVGNWLLMGLIVRLGFRQGFHRDPAHFPDISPFKGEMRRKIWLAIYCMDVMLSIQMGVPRLIRDGTWDTKLPRNLVDSDLVQDHQGLPPARPNSEVTPVLTMTMKHSMIRVLGMASDLTMNLGPSQKSDVDTIEKLLQSTYASLPESLKFTSISQCLADSPKDIIDRVTLAVLLQKGLMMIYWHYISTPDAVERQHEQASLERFNTKKELSQSVEMAVNAALRVLEFQHIIETETQPGGTLFPLKWRISSIISHEFLMATTILCSFLCRTSRNTPGSRDALVNNIDEKKGHEIEIALSRAHRIWIAESAHSQEARSAASMLDTMFNKLRGSHSTQPCNLDAIPNFGNSQRRPHDLMLNHAIPFPFEGNLYGEGQTGVSTLSQLPFSTTTSHYPNEERSPAPWLEE